MIRIAHRGIDCEYPENTLENLELAFQSNCDAVEIDLRSTKDGKIFISHDGFWRRDGRFIDSYFLTGEVVRRSEIVPTKNGVIGTIPYFEEVYSIFRKSNKILIAEIKYENINLRILDLFFDFFKGKSSENIIVSSFSLALLRKFREHRKDFILAKTGQRFNKYWMDKIDVPFQQFHFRGDLLDEERMDYFHRRGWDVYAWTVNEEIEFRRMENLGVKGIFTDNLDGLNQYLKNADNL